MPESLVVSQFHSGDSDPPRIAYGIAVRAIYPSIGGAVVIEQIFNLPGLGRLILDSLGRRDYTMVSGINLFIAFAVILVNLAVDLTYAFLDPRIRYS